MNRKETLALLNQFGIRPTRSLGQNFLINDQVIDQICSVAGISQQDLVIEIGPGIGSLTRELAIKAGRVMAIEIDRHVLPALEHVLVNYSNSSVTHADALEVDIKQLIGDWSGPVKVVANLPYYITTPLIVKILCELPESQEMVLMIQKEAADRVMASPGSKQHGPLSVLVACYGLARKEINVPAASFYPQPGVDSCVIRIKRNNKLQKINWQGFRHFLENCFAQRRKTLVNSLKASGLTQDRQSHLLQWFEKQGLAADIRAEKLQAEQFIGLYQEISCEKP